MLEALEIVHEDRSVGVITLCGEGPLAFCSGGDQTVRGNAGYIGDDGVPRLNILDVQRKIRTLPKPVRGPLLSRRSRRSESAIE